MISVVTVFVSVDTVWLYCIAHPDVELSKVPVVALKNNASTPLLIGGANHSNVVITA